VLAAAPARAAALLAASAIASAMRTMTWPRWVDAWARMRTSASALLLAGVVLCPQSPRRAGLWVSSRAGVGLALGEGVLLVSIGALRVYSGHCHRAAAPPARFRAGPGAVRRRGPLWAGPSYWWWAVARFWSPHRFGAGWISSTGTSIQDPLPVYFVIWLAVALIGFASRDGRLYTGQGRGAQASELGGVVAEAALLCRLEKL